MSVNSCHCTTKKSENEFIHTHTHLHLSARFATITYHVMRCVGPGCRTPLIVVSGGRLVRVLDGDEGHWSAGHPGQLVAAPAVATRQSSHGSCGFYPASSSSLSSSPAAAAATTKQQQNFHLRNTHQRDETSCSPLRAPPAGRFCRHPVRGECEATTNYPA